MKNDKIYTLVFNHAGVKNKADFYEKDGKLVNPSLFGVSYYRGELPSLEGLETIDDVLNELVKYFPGIKLDKIDGLPLSYYHNATARSVIGSCHKNIDDYITTQAKILFELILLPIMIENDWFFSTSHIGIPVLIEGVGDGEWQNIADKDKEAEFEYICKRFIKPYSDVKYPISAFLNYLGYGYIKEQNLLIEI